MRTTLVFLCLSLFVCFSTYAQSTATGSSEGDEVLDGTQTAGGEAVEEEAPDYPKKGVLSATGSVGFANLSIKEPWQGPVKGSISKVKNRDWEVNVQNTDEKHTFQMSCSVEQFTQSNNQLKVSKRSPFSVRLAPGAESKRTIRGINASVGARIVVSSWRIVK